MLMVGRVSHLLHELTASYIPANAHLTRINLLSLERALAFRRMVIAKMQEPPDEAGYQVRKQLYDSKETEIGREVDAARKLINGIIEDTSTPSDNAALARIDSRIESLMNDVRPRLKQESEELLSQLEAPDLIAVRQHLAHADVLRDDLDEKIDAIRSQMVKTSYGAIATIELGAEPGLYRLRDRHDPCSRRRVDLRQPRQRRHRSLGPTAARRCAGGRGWKSRSIDRCYDG